MLTSPGTFGVCVSCVALALVAHSGAGFTARIGAACPMLFSMATGLPDSQNRPFCGVTSDDSIEAARAPAVAPSCSDES